VGMAQIFKGLPGMGKLMSYWYHYAIMFEALFILTTIDTGTRVARYVLQEVLGKAYKPFANTAWLPGNLVSTLVIVFAWGWMIYSGTISTIWPLFGTGNQLLATIALAVVMTYLVNCGKARYAWIPGIPMLFVGATTITAGILSVKNIFWPMTYRPLMQDRIVGYLDSVLMVIFIVGVVLVVCNAVVRIWRTLSGQPVPATSFGAPEPAEMAAAAVNPNAPARCC